MTLIWFKTATCYFSKMQPLRRAAQCSTGPSYVEHVVLFCVCSLFYQNGNAAASLSVAEQYVSAFSNLAKQTNTIILPSNTGDISSMVTQVSLRHAFITKDQPFPLYFPPNMEFYILIKRENIEIFHKPLPENTVKDLIL